MKVVSVIGILAMVILISLASTSSVGLFIDIPSFVALFGVLLFMALGRFGKVGLAPWTLKSPAMRNEVILWHEKYVMKSAHLAFLLGILVLLAHTNFNHATDMLNMIGPALNVCLIPYLYASIYICLIQSLKLTDSVEPNVDDSVTKVEPASKVA